MSRSSFVRFLAAAVVLAAAVLAAGCGTTMPPGVVPTAHTGAAGAGGASDGQSGTITPTTALALGPASDATSFEVGWTRQATVPVAGDVLQVVLGDASLLPPDAVEDAYRRRVDAALAAAEGAATPEERAAAAAVADAAIAKLEAYHQSRIARVTSTGTTTPGVVIFLGTKIVHGTTSADVPSAAVVGELAKLAQEIAGVTSAAKGAPAPAAGK